MIDKYPDYFQKSMFFLYPLLDLNKDMQIVPENTYLGIEGYITEKEPKVVCRFANTEDPKFTQFKNLYIYQSPYFLEELERESPDETLYVFDLSPYHTDYELFLKGEYSRMAEPTKRKIMRFYRYGTAPFEYMKSFLFPDQYYQIYADLLHVTREVLQNSVELASKYDQEKEVLKAP